MSAQVQVGAPSRFGTCTTALPAAGHYKPKRIGSAAVERDRGQGHNRGDHAPAWAAI